MTDRDLLELAAKAAGIKVPTKKDYPYAHIDEHGIHRDVSCGGDGTKMSHWNPLTNDGDALRLAVRLGLCVQVLRQYGETQVFRQSGYEIEKHNDDPFAATRRAIVCAAAEIGRAMS